jgi:hypothetical protein
MNLNIATDIDRHAGRYYDLSTSVDIDMQVSGNIDNRDIKGKGVAVA